MPGIQEERQWQVWDVTTERGERRSRLTRVQKEETGLQKSTCLPLPPAPVVGTEDRDKSYTGPLLVTNMPELRKSPSWLSTHSQVIYNAPSKFFWSGFWPLIPRDIEFSAAC